MAERLAGNAGEGNPEGQKVIDSGTGGKAGGFDSDIDEKAKSVGPAKPPEDGKGVNINNTPDGQKLVG